MTSETEYECINCGTVMTHTRAVPDVPELERVNFEVSKHGMLVEKFCAENGKYVLHSQAVAIISAKDVRIEEGEQERQVMAKDWFNFCELIGIEIDSHEAIASKVNAIKQRAEAAEAKLATLKEAIKVKGGNEHSPTQDAYNLACAAIEKHRKRADDAEAKLAQYEAQKPVAWRGKFRANSSEFWEYYAHPDSGFDPDKYEQEPLYASPAPCQDLKAKNERLREALKPFAEYMRDYGDKDHLGNPLPNEQGVSFIYLNHGHFRAARTALNAKASPLAPEGGRE